MDKPTAIDGSKGPLITRRVVAWRRLEPGDVRTPGTEIAPESPHVEAKVFEVGIEKSLFEDLERLWAKKGAVTKVASGWSTRYEPAGVLLSIGGGLAVGALLAYLPQSVYPVAGSLTLLGVAVAVLTRTRKTKSEQRAERAWRNTDERKELSKIEKRLTPRWEKFAARLIERTGFRTDLRVGDVHEIDRLVSIDTSMITHPDTWREDGAQDEVRYGWAYADGNVVIQVAELENSDAENSDAASGDEASGEASQTDEEE